MILINLSGLNNFWCPQMGMYLTITRLDLHGCIYTIILTLH